MRFSITIPDELVARIDTKAAEAGINRAEWIRTTCTTAITTPITELESIIETYRDANFDQADRIKELTAERDRLQEVINGDQRGDHEVTTLRAELQHKDHLLATQRDEILWLRSEVAKLNDRIPMLPAGDRKWWMFWRTQ